MASSSSGVEVGGFGGPGVAMVLPGSSSGAETGSFAPVLPERNQATPPRASSDHALPGTVGEQFGGSAPSSTFARSKHRASTFSLGGVLNTLRRGSSMPDASSSFTKPAVNFGNTTGGVGTVGLKSQGWVGAEQVLQRGSAAEGRHRRATEIGGGLGTLATDRLKGLAALGSANAEPLQLSCVLDVVSQMLSVQELKLAIGLLKYLSGASIGKVMLPVSQDDFRATLADYLRKVKGGWKQSCGESFGSLRSFVADANGEVPVMCAPSPPDTDDERHFGGVVPSPIGSPEPLRGSGSFHSAGASFTLDTTMSRALSPGSGVRSADSSARSARASLTGTNSAQSSCSELKGKKHRKSNEETEAAVARLNERKLRKPVKLGGLTLCKEEVEWLGRSSHWFMIRPTNTWRMTWDLLSFFFIVVEAMLVPLVICFELGVPEFWFWMTTIFFAIDICLNMITGYYQDGTLVCRLRWTIDRYLKTWFLLDLFSTMPWELAADVFLPDDSQDVSANAMVLKLSKLWRIMRVFRLLRVIKLKHLIARLEDVLHSKSFIVALSLLKMLALFVMLCHWVACVWSFLGDPTKVGQADWPVPPDQCEPGGPCEGGILGSPWRRRYRVEFEALAVQYITALHFATALITGSEMEIQPGFWLEKVFVIGMMIVSFLVCSMILSHIVVVVDKINQDGKEFIERMRNVKEFMVSRKVPFTLQVKVKRYLEYQFRSRRDRQELGECDFMSHLSPWLFVELKDHLNRKVIARHPFFANMPLECLKQMCCKASSVLYAPSDSIFQKGHIADSLVFCVRGRLRVLTAGHERGDRHCPVIEPGFWIGDLCLFVGQIRLHTVQSVVHSEVLRILKSHVDQVCSKFPKTKQYYEEHKKRIQSGDHTFLDCAYCHTGGHNEDACPQNPNNQTVRREEEVEDKKKESPWSSKNVTRFAMGMLFKKELTQETPVVSTQPKSPSQGSKKSPTSSDGVADKDSLTTP